MSGWPRAPKAPTQRQLDAVHDELGFALTRGDGWTTYHEVARRLGYNPRTVRLCARELVAQGIPVVSDSRMGYRIEDDPVKVREAARKLRSRAVAILERASALERWAQAEEDRRGASRQPGLFAGQPEAVEVGSAR